MFQIFFLFSGSARKEKIPSHMVTVLNIFDPSGGTYRSSS